MSQLASEQDLFCPACGYNLRGVESARCPECGVEFDRDKLAESVIPWVHRKKIGRVRAFLKTVWLTIRRPSVIARDMARPVSYRDAQMFRWIVVAITSIPLIAWMLTAQIINLDEIGRLPAEMSTGLWSTPLPHKYWLDLLVCWCRVAGTMWYLTPAIIVLLVISLTGIASYFFHPRELDTVRQNRAIALSYCACGPLSLMISAPAILLPLLYLLQYPTREFEVFQVQFIPFFGLASGVVFFGGVLVGGFSWWWGTLRILAGTTFCSLQRWILASVMLPIIWLALPVLFFIVLPLILGFVVLMVESYWI